MRAWIGVGVLVAVVAAAPADASGQSEAERKRTAKAHFQKGTTYYDLGKFDEAIAEFEKAYEAFPDPVFLYNIAQAYRMKGEVDRAIFAYRRYLAKAPNAPNRAEVEGRIAELEEQKKRAAEPPPPERKPEERKPEDRKPEDRKPEDRKPEERKPVVTPPERPPEEKPVLVARGGGSDDDDPDAAGGGRGGGDTMVSTTAAAKRPVQLGLEAGFVMIDLGGGPEVPAQFAAELRGAYALTTMGSFGLGVGGSLTYSPIPYENQIDGSTGTAGLFGAMVGADLRLALGSGLGVRAGLGLGVTWFTGLRVGNPFTEDGVAATGPVPMFAFRAGIGLELVLGGGLVVSATPLGFAMSPPPENLEHDIEKIQRIEILFGLGYAL